MWNGKKKALTFSYDDGVTQDARLIEIFNRYGLKATFNLNSEKLGRQSTLTWSGITVDHSRVASEDVRALYVGHEVAVHTLTHPLLPAIEDDAEVIRQVEQDRINLSELVGYEVVGMAYPCGGENNDERVARLIRENTGVRYARALKSDYSFSTDKDLYRFQASVYHRKWEQMLDLADRFLSEQSEEPMLFYIWGHSYEFDFDPSSWDRFEELCRRLSGHDEVFYGTNREVLLGE